MLHVACMSQAAVQAEAMRKRHCECCARSCSGVHYTCAHAGVQEILRYISVLLALQPLPPEGAAGAAADGEPAAESSQVSRA